MKWLKPSRIGAIIGVIAIVGGILSPSTLVQSWHFATIVCLQPALGSLLLILIFQITGGRWGESLLPALTVGRRMIPWCILAFLPVIAFLPAVYHWADDPEQVGDRQIFLNWPFYTIRSGIYLAVFTGLSWCIAKRWRPAAGGLILFALIAYFLAIDAIMAIDPSWYSSGFPVVFMANEALMAMALAIYVQATCFAHRKIEPKVWRDLGNLLLTMVVFWSYVSFTQFLIIWSGNLKEEIEWYLIRVDNGWRWVIASVALANLFIPFFLLLSRAIKENPHRLRRVALLILISQTIYLYWLMAPAYPGRLNSGAHWLDLVVLLGVASWFLGRIKTLANRGKAIPA